MSQNKIVEAILLRPASFLYGMGVGIRNMLFSCGILKSKEYDIPVISVGNIAAGGTGKTPHTEYLIRLLRTGHKVGVLSRGYGRKTSGFIRLDSTSTPETVGDEPYQMYKKFGGNVMFAVCEKRTEGIEKMREIDPKLQDILLDDAFQHQYVKPSLSIVLTEFNRPVFNDRLLPLGRLRESMSALNRCDMVIVTKCPPKLKPIEYRIFKDKLNLFPYQQMFFSHFVYGTPKALFQASAQGYFSLDNLTEKDSILSVTGIANPRPFVSYLRKHMANVKVKTFEDHHKFTKADFDLIQSRFDNLTGDSKFILTTEKDAVKIMQHPDFPAALKPHIFYIPVDIEIEKGDSGEFDTVILDSVKKSLAE